MFSDFIHPSNILHVTERNGLLMTWSPHHERLYKPVCSAEASNALLIRIGTSAVRWHACLYSALIQSKRYCVVVIPFYRVVSFHCVLARKSSLFDPCARPTKKESH